MANPRYRFPAPVGLLAGAGAMLLCPPTPAGVHGCTDAAGNRTYTQFGCPLDTHPLPDSNGEGRLSVVTAVPLSDAERDMLAALSRELDQARRQREQANRKAARRRAVRAAEAERRCAQAERELAALAELRRRGYTVSEGRRYDDEEARWRGVRRDAC
jgi:hypothetical protein